MSACRVAAAPACLLRIFTCARTGWRGASHRNPVHLACPKPAAQQFARSRPPPRAAKPGRSRSHRAARGAAMPRPRRCPTVKWWTPRCSPRRAPVGGHDLAARALERHARSPADTRSGRRRNRRWARSRSPGCRPWPPPPAPASAPARRTSGLVMPPSGNSVRASCGCVRPNRKYVWSLDSSTPRRNW